MTARHLSAAYIRYSSHAQDDSTSVELQREAISRQAGPCVEYLDQAKTGRAIAGRSALRRLLDDAEAGRIATVYVYKYDRLGRDLAEAAMIVRQIEDAGATVVSACTGDPKGIFVAVRREELVEFAEHLRCRLVTQYRRLRAVRHTQAAEVAAETQGSLF